MKLEKREFYTNSSSQSEDLRFNKERLNGKEGIRLFLNGNYPDQEVFEKLFLSQLFKLNNEDRAKETGNNTQTSDTGIDKILGGHVTIATDLEAKSFDDGETNSYTRTVRPSQLPETIEGLLQEITIDDDVFSGIMLNLFVDSTGSRNIYQHRLSGTFLLYLKSLIEEGISPVGSISQILGNQIETGKPWIILDGSNISKESKPDSTYIGNDYKNLYFHISRANGILEASIQSNWDSNVSITLPNVTPVVNGSFTFNYIIKY